MARRSAPARTVFLQQRGSPNRYGSIYAAVISLASLISSAHTSCRGQPRVPMFGRSAQLGHEFVSFRLLLYFWLVYAGSERCLDPPDRTAIFSGPWLRTHKRACSHFPPDVYNVVLTCTTAPTAPYTMTCHELWCISVRRTLCTPTGTHLDHRVPTEIRRALSLHSNVYKPSAGRCTCPPQSLHTCVRFRQSVVTDAFNICTPVPSVLQSYGMISSL